MSPQSWMGTSRISSRYIETLSGERYKLAHEIESFDLPSNAKVILGGTYLGQGNASVGFDGRLVWFYSYAPGHNSDVLGTTSPERCAYEIYDSARHGVRVRDLPSASGPWAALNKSCRVHALLPTTDEGAIAFASEGARTAEVVRFSGPP